MLSGSQLVTIARMFGGDFAQCRPWAAVGSECEERRFTLDYGDGRSDPVVLDFPDGTVARVFSAMVRPLVGPPIQRPYSSLELDRRAS